MSLFITIFFYTSFSFLALFTFWTFMTFFVTRIRYRTTRMLKGSDKDLESIRQQMKKVKKSIVLEGDTSDKSMYMLEKAFDKIRDGMISKSLQSENIETEDNSDNKESVKDSNNKEKS